EHAVEDAQKKELVEARNQADASVYLAEKALKDGGDKVPVDVQSAVRGKIDALKKAKEADNLDALKSALADLSAEIQKIGQAFYNKGDGNADTGTNENPGTEPGK
ncbi:MAG TPA: Hsp70 family protein, partial [Candidatus Paceibacterota bacterium]|nr:Hsp70 family protein [Candidatus Paceibacterota bacterium]